MAMAAAFAVMAHDAWSDAVAALVERTADDVLLPLTGATLRSALHLPDAIADAALEGDGLACEAVKPSDDGDWIVLRCRNVTSVERRGAWTLGVPVSMAQLARLDVDALIDSLVDDYLDTGHRVRIEGRAGVPLATRPQALRRILANLVDNALKYCPDGAAVRVLIAYGSYWFPWYMRRLAERPANVAFLLGNVLRESLRKT